MRISDSKLAMSASRDMAALAGRDAEREKASTQAAMRSTTSAPATATNRF